MDSSKPLALDLQNKYASTFESILTSALQRIQEKENYTKGVYFIEIVRECDPETKELAKKGLPFGFVMGAFSMLIEKDVFLMNHDCNEYSLKPLPGYRSFSEVIANDYPGLKWNYDTKVLYNESAPTINLKKMTKLFLSKEGEFEGEKKEFEDIISKYKEVFLDGDDVPRIILTSLLRSGNSMFRRLFEQTSGIITGSTLQGVLPDQLQLTCLGFKGEGIIDNQIWFLKSHFPYTSPLSIIGHGSRALVLVRNPVDCMVSLLHLASTNTHDLRLGNDFPKEFPKEWEFHVKQIAQVWNQFYNFYIDLGRKREIPVYFIRFEDTLKDKFAALCEAYSFILGVEDIKGTYIEKRIKEVLEHESFGYVYKAKEGGVSKNFEMFSPAYINYIKRICATNIHFFGYSQFEGIENDSACFQFDEVKDSDRENFGKFRELNKQMKDWYIAKKQELEVNKFEVETPGKDLGIKLKDEPFVRLLALRSKYFIARK